MELARDTVQVLEALLAADLPATAAKLTERERFIRCLAETARHEGGYVDHPRDPGGATNPGVTLCAYGADSPGAFLTVGCTYRLPVSTASLSDPYGEVLGSLYVLDSQSRVSDAGLANNLVLDGSGAPNVFGVSLRGGTLGFRRNDATLAPYPTT